MSSINLPDDPRLAGKIIDAEASQQAQRLEMGWLGRVLGGRAGAPSNAASLIVYGLTILLGFLLLYGTESASFTRKDAVASVVSLITLALGFLFGKGARS